MSDYNLRNERETLAQVAAALRAGTIEGKFDMGEAASQYDCGTVACIGGWAWLFENPDDFDGAQNFVGTQTGALDNLLYWVGYYGDLSPEHAADAIDNYLAGDKVPWQKVEGNRYNE
jgi:hypothetical protein